MSLPKGMMSGDRQMGWDVGVCPRSWKLSLTRMSSQPAFTASAFMVPPARSVRVGRRTARAVRPPWPPPSAAGAPMLGQLAAWLWTAAPLSHATGSTGSSPACGSDGGFAYAVRTEASHVRFGPGLRARGACWSSRRWGCPAVVGSVRLPGKRALRTTADGGRPHRRPDMWSPDLSVSRSCRIGTASAPRCPSADGSTAWIPRSWGAEKRPDTAKVVRPAHPPNHS